MRSGAPSGTRPGAPATNGSPSSSREPGSRSGSGRRNLTDRQQAKLAFIQELNAPIYRAYLLKEQLRGIYHASSTEDALALLESWLKWARRCRLEPFVKLAKRIAEQRARVEAALRHSLSNARVEQINTQIRLIVRRGFGYHSPNAVIALAMLSLGGLCPPLPGR
jgi:transposase